MFVSDRKMKNKEVHTAYRKSILNIYVSYCDMTLTTYTLLKAILNICVVCIIMYLITFALISYSITICHLGEKSLVLRDYKEYIMKIWA